ncbi:hypothetical protein D3C74_50190 [compost metagenome]
MPRVSKNPLKRLLPRGTKAADVLFVCVGTDRSTGDSLGPMVGSVLKRKGFNVLGTLDDPVHATNLVDKLTLIPEDVIVVGIDACLGKQSSVGKVMIEEGPLKPGAGVGKKLPYVGEYRITGIVNIGGFMEYFVLQNTRLSLIFKLRDEIVETICSALPGRRKINVASPSDKIRVVEPKLLVLP